MVRRALGYIARTGPSTQQDRWEENEGINAFTLGVCIAALVAGAALLPAAEAGLGAGAGRFLERADRGLDHRQRHRAGAATTASRAIICGSRRRASSTEAGASTAIVPIRNRSATAGCAATSRSAPSSCSWCASGCAAPDDPLILGSLQLADALLRTDTPNGPVWHRYSGDGYGEHDDGRAFDGTGIGRGWPLLTGERGHFELCAGNDPLPYLRRWRRWPAPAG